MIYVIENKPYIKVSNYFRGVTIEKKGNEYVVKPIKSKEAKIEVMNPYIKLNPKIKKLFEERFSVAKIIVSREYCKNDSACHKKKKNLYLCY